MTIYMLLTSSNILWRNTNLKKETNLRKIFKKITANELPWNTNFSVSGVKSQKILDN